VIKSQRDHVRVIHSVEAAVVSDQDFHTTKTARQRAGVKSASRQRRLLREQRRSHPDMRSTASEKVRDL